MSKELFALAYKKINEYKGSYSPYIVLGHNIIISDVRKLAVVKNSTTLAYAKTGSGASVYFKICDIMELHLFEEGEEDNEQEDDTD